MHDNKELNQSKRDEELALFVDQILAGETPEEIDLSHDEELRGLQETVLALKHARPGDPDKAMAARIRAETLKAYRLEYDPLVQRQVRPAKPHKAQHRPFWNTARGRREFGFRFAAAALVVLVAALFVFPSLGDGMSATAGITDPPWGPLLIGGVLFLIFGAFVWWFRRR